MADNPDNPEQLASRARQWFAEAREASAKDEAEVKSWKSGMRDWGYCLSNSFWDRVDWVTDRDFHWRDKLRRQQGKPNRRLWENK